MNDARETEKPPRCERLFGSHHWSKWADVRSGSYKVDGLVRGNWIEQERRCEDCGRLELRREMT